MTTPGGGERIAGFSSPMGTGNMAKRMSAAAAADLAQLASSAKTYRTNMEAAAKAAEKATAEVKKQASVLKEIRQLTRTEVEAKYSQQGWSGGQVRGGATGNGGGASMPALPVGGGSGGGLDRKGGTTLISGAAPPRGNGGGARFGGMSPYVQDGQWTHPSGGNGGNASFSSPGTVDGEVANGGGSKVPGLGAAMKAAGLGFAAGMAAEMVDPKNFRTTDFLANRAARISGTPYDKRAGAQTVTRMGANSFRSAEEQRDFFMPLITDNRTGFVAGSAQHNVVTEGARVTAALNPLAGGTAGQTSVNLGKPELFNNLRMMTGIETIGRGGAPKTPAEIARQLVSSTTQGRFGSSVGAASMSSPQTEAALGETGGLRLQMRAAGMDENMQSAISEYLRESAITGKYVGSKSINSRATAGSNTMMGTEQENATAKQDLTASLVKEYADGYAAASKLVRDGMSELADAIRGLPEAVRAVLGGVAGAAGASTQFGAPGKAFGAGAGVAAGLLGGAAARRVASSRVGTRAAARLAGRRAAMGAGTAVLGVTGAAGAGILAGVGALGFGIKGAMGADYSGDLSDDVASMWEHGLGGVFGYKANRRPPGETGDGPGRKAEPRFGTAAFPGVAGAEIGDGEGGTGGRGKGTIDYLKQLMARSGLPHRITSTKRSGSGKSYHNTGHAIDIAGPTPGENTPEMLAINRYLATKLGRGAAELIYSGPGGTNLLNGNPHTYSKDVRRIHHNHVHVAVTNASLERSGRAMTAAEETNAMRGEKGVARQQRSVGRGKSVGNGRRTQQGRSGVGFSERRLIEDFMGGIGGDRFTASPAAATDSLEGRVNSATVQGSGAAGPSAGAHVVDKYLYGLRMHESRGDYTAENGGTRGAHGPNDTSASGAYQYIDGTWNNYRGYKYAAAAPPAIQDERARMDASRLYTKYGNWQKVAAAHFRGEGWLKQNPDPADWGGKGPGANPTTTAFVKDVLSRAGLPETGDGPGSAGSITADVPRPQQQAHGAGGGGGSLRVSNRTGGSVHIAKVEVHLTTPQVSEAEAHRIGKMVVDKIAMSARMSEMSD